MCMSGMMRTGPWAAPHIREFAAGFPGQVDWFIHVWDWSQQKPSVAGETFPRIETSHAMVSAMREIYQPRMMVVGDHDAVVQGLGLDPNSGHSQWAGIGICDFMRERWSNETGLGHDMVVRLRPDVVYTRYNTLDVWAWLVRNSAPNVLWSAVCDDRRVDDVIWAARPDAMSGAARFWRRIADRPEGPHDHERGFVNHLKGLGIEARQPLGHGLPIECRVYAPVRNTALELDPVDSFAEIYRRDLRHCTPTCVYKGETIPTEEWVVKMDDWLKTL